MLAALYPTKRALAQAKGQALRYQETSLFGSEYRADGELTVVGPSAYTRKFYARATMCAGTISRVR